MARPTIGDFRGADQNKPRPPPAPPPPSAVIPPPVEEPAVEEKEETPTPDTADKTPAPTEGEVFLKKLHFMTPAERYREQLKKLNIDIKTAEAIYDAVLSKGYYEEYVRIRGNQRAVFRTRAYEDHLRLQTVIEMQKPQMAISQDELITRYNLAASLCEWNGVALKHDNDNDFDKVMTLIKRLPGPLFTVLARELSKFDAKVMAVFDEGADENFS